MNKTLKLLSASCAMFLVAPVSFAEETVTPKEVVITENTITQDERMGWWRDARFGMFIHWGLYSILGGEWEGKDYGKEAVGTSAEWVMKKAKISGEEYRKLSDEFNPTKFNAVEWVSMAKAAGMKYMVITAKHHDGFCLFDTKHTDFDVMDATPFKRDIIKELSEECKKQGLRFGVYYSQNQDWYHRYNKGLRKDGTMTDSEYLEMVQKHMDELLTNYGDMAVLWFDTGGGDLADADRQGARVRELQPKTIICSRLYKKDEKQKTYADFKSLPDRTIASAREEGDTETCMTMRHNWGYDQDDDNWKTTKDVIERLVLSSARGVNFLLNVGPSPEGTFVAEEISILKEIAQWMKVNGESIYETDYSPFNFDFPWGTITQKSKKLYLHVMSWTPNEVVFNGVISQPTKAYFLSDPERKPLVVRYEAKGHISTIEVPEKAPDVKNSVIVLEFDVEVETDKEAQSDFRWKKSTGVEHNRN